MSSSPIPPSPPAKAQISIWREAAAAAFGGTLHAVVEQPLVIPIEASITQTQVNGRNFAHNFTDLYRRGALYRSLPTALAGAVPKAVFHYSILTAYVNTLVATGDMKTATTKEATLVGVAVGATEVCLTNPINFVKFRMQRPEWGYKGMVDAVQTIARTEGIAAFWKGTTFVFMRNSICNGGMVGGYKFFDGALESALPDMNESARHFTAGALGGVFGSFVSYPFEMLRAAKQQNISFYDEIYSKGFKRLLAGWTPGAVRLVLTSAIMGSIIPHLKSVSNSLILGTEQPQRPEQQDYQADNEQSKQLQGDEHLHH